MSLRNFVSVEDTAYRLAETCQGIMQELEQFKERREALSSTEVPAAPLGPGAAGGAPWIAITTVKDASGPLTRDEKRNRIMIKILEVRMSLPYGNK
jgi:hypothetical protein